MPSSLPVNLYLRLLTLAAFASSASFRVCDPLLPAFASSFGVSAGQAATSITLFTIAYGAMQLIYGPLGERFNRFRIITLATALCALGSIGALLAASLQWLLVSRLLTGIAAAGIIPLSMAWIADRLPAEQRQAALARFFSGQIMGMVFGQVVGGLSVDFGNWRLSFALLTVLYLLIALALLHQGKAERQSAAAQGTPPSMASLYHKAFMLLKAPDTRGVLWSFLLEAALVFPVIAFLPLYLHQHFAQPLSRSSLALLLYGIGGLLFSAFAARQGPRLNQPRWPLAAALLIAAADVAILLAPHPAWIYAATLISGFGYYLLHNALLFQVTQRVPQARSLALALSVSIFFIGQSLGISAASWLVDREQLTLVFMLAATGMPLLGWLTARRVRALAG